MPSHFTPESNREYVRTERVGSKFLAFTVALTVFAFALSGQRVRSSLPTSTHGMAQRGARPGRVVAARVHREIESSSPLARAFFDEGLSQHYAYRHSASVEAFR